MATITGMTADAMSAIRDGTVVGAIFDSAGHLILTKHDGTIIDGGPVGSATTGQSGIVELATSAETQTGTDATRAVTPQGLASIPGNKVQILANNAIAESATPTSYPSGISLMVLTSSTWTVSGGNGSVVTDNTSTDRCVQTFYSSAGGTAFPRSWKRTYHSSVGGGGWTAWVVDLGMVNLNPASFTQTSLLSAYPLGWSRIYYTASTSSAWDFSGKYGEVVTYVDGTDFAKQTWTLHTNGGGGKPEVWVRTANASGGWSAWIVAVEDTGWQNLSLSAGTVLLPCSYRRRNGIVYLKGTLQAPSGGFTTIATLPVGYRPLETRIFPVTSNASIYMALQVNSTGTVQSWTSASTTQPFSLSGVTFPFD